MIDYDWRAEISTEDGPLRCVLQHCCDGLWRWYAPMRGGPALAVGGSAEAATEALFRHYRADVWDLRICHNGAQIWP